MRRCWCLVMAIVLAACGGPRRELSPITLDSMMKLGADSGDGAIATTPLVSARHPGGYRIVVTSVGAIASLPLVFDDGGEFLGSLRADTTAMGTSYRPRFTRFGPGDSIWVFDNARRALVFDPFRRYVRTVQFPAGRDAGGPPLFDAVVLSDSRIAAITLVPKPAQLLSANGSVERNIPVYEIDKPEPPPAYRVALAPDGTLWTTNVSGVWHVEHWDAHGKPLGKLEPAAPWLVDSNETERRNSLDTPDLPPAPSVQGIWVDIAGRLWVLGSVADRRWREGVVRTDSGGTQHIEPDRYYDTIVEVRDPKSGDLIASARFDIACQSVAEPGVLVHEVETRGGWRRAELLRVVLNENAIRKTR
jgi:hypothetical protein